MKTQENVASVTTNVRRQSPHTGVEAEAPWSSGLLGWLLGAQRWPGSMWGVFQQKWSITQFALKMETVLVQAQCQGHSKPQEMSASLPISPAQQPQLLLLLIANPPPSRIPIIMQRILPGPISPLPISKIMDDARSWKEGGSGKSPPSLITRAVNCSCALTMEDFSKPFMEGLIHVHTSC